MRKPMIAILAACALCLGLFAACSSAPASSTASGSSASSAQSNTPGESASGQSASQNEKCQVVCATFPAYDWVKQVIGDKADAYEITYLMGSGVDLHSYQPTVEDIAKISDANLFVYVGGESDEWAEDAVEAANNAELHVVNMLETMGDAAVEEEIVEGMEAGEHAHDHEAEAEADDHDHEAEAEAESSESESSESEPSEESAESEGHHHDGEEGPEYDEHVWLSLKNAQKLVDAIASELSAIDAANADAYAANAKAYNAQLAALDERYAEAVKSAAKDTVIFADRFPFRYLVDDYDLNYYAAFVGCSAETEASFETIAFLANKVDELGISNVCVIETSDRTIAETVIQNTKEKNQGIQAMDSLQSATESDVAAGKTYLGAMEDNLTALTAALS